MSVRSRVKRMTLILFTSLVILVLWTISGSNMLAAGGIALSGSFYRQEFTIPPGASVTGPSVYVIVFNNGEENLSVRMSGKSPEGVKIELSETEFVLPSKGQKQVFVSITVSRDATPGEYDLTITAESYKEGATGIQVAGAASQKAKLTITGDASKIIVKMASPDGTPLSGLLRLFRLMSNGEEHEIAYGETEMLEARVSPGDYKAGGYISDEKKDKQTFQVTAGESKEITLTGRAIYFESFGVI
ncbi:MAG: hypothetical protein N3E40_04865, partial [Dehalococcoidia bacterium]|nr:hypothetical protein [Dehalococcoidia bacterium]